MPTSTYSTASSAAERDRDEVPSPGGSAGSAYAPFERLWTAITAPVVRLVAA